MYIHILLNTINLNNNDNNNIYIYKYRYKQSYDYIYNQSLNQLIQSNDSILYYIILYNIIIYNIILYNIIIYDLIYQQRIEPRVVTIENNPLHASYLKQLDGKYLLKKKYKYLTNRLRHFLL